MMESKAYSVLLNELNTMESYILGSPAKSTELGITDAQLQQLNHYVVLFRNNMSDYLNPSKKTAIVVHEARDHYKEITRWIGRLRQGIKYSKVDTLTEVDYENLFIHKDKTTHSRHLSIAEVPTLEVKSQKGGTVFLGAFIAGSEVHSKPKFPQFVHSLALHWCFDDSMTPPDPASINQYEETFGTANPKLVISATNERKYCHILAYYVLPNGTKSQPSQIFTFVTSTI